MSTNLSTRAYYAFMFLLPLIFYSGTADFVLLPRQLALSIFALLLIGLVWKATRDNDRSFKFDFATLAMLTYLLLAAIISFLNAAVWSESLYAVSKLWLVISVLVLTVLLLKANVITRKQIIIAAIIFGCVSIITALIDISGKSIHGKHLLRSVDIVSGGFANKNLLSSILFLCIPFFLVGTRYQRPLKVLSYVALFFTVFILVVIRTRIALIATIVFFGIIGLFYLSKHLKRRFWPAISVSVGTVLLGLLAVKSYHSFGKLHSSPDHMTQYFYRLLSTDTLRERLLFWQNSWEMFLEYPFGVGLGNWQFYFPKYGLDKFNSFPIENGLHTLQRPHNDFLWSLCETGIFGFAAYIGIFGIVLYQSFKLIGIADDEREKWTFIYLFSGLIGFMTISFFDFPMERIEHLVMLLLLFSLIIHQYAIKNNSSFGILINRKSIMIFLVSGVCFSVTVAMIRFSAEKDIFETYAARANNYNDEVISLTESANGYFYQIDSKTMPLDWYKGVAQFAKQQYAESERSFENAYFLTPYNIHVINNLASCYEINNKRNNAIAMYSKALAISPHFEEARLNLAAVYFNSKAYEKAFTTIDSCAIGSRDPKYKIFLPPILKVKANAVIKYATFPISAENKTALTDLQDYSSIYFESKMNNITFEQQIIRRLKK